MKKNFLGSKEDLDRKVYVCKRLWDLGVKEFQYPDLPRIARSLDQADPDLAARVRYLYLDWHQSMPRYVTQGCPVPE